MYKPEFFTAQELVPPAIYQRRGDKSLELLDDRLLATMDQLRHTFGPCTVNN